MVNLSLLSRKIQSEQIKLLGKIEKFIKKKRVNSIQQITIDQYFK
jgi:Mlc titration factor MtfA (ptsG expression regulator)